MYQVYKSNTELTFQLYVGLKKHLIIAQDTSQPKKGRIESLTNLSEVLEYVITHINEAIPADEQAILIRFFSILLTKVKTALVSIHSSPVSFIDEIAFLTMLLKL